MVTSNGFCLLPNTTSCLVNKTPCSRLSFPWPVTGESCSRYGWKVEWLLPWRDTRVLHDTERDKWWSWHCGGCALAPGTRAPLDHSTLLEVGGTLPADPDSVGMAGSRGRDCHQGKNHSLLFPCFLPFACSFWFTSRDSTIWLHRAHQPTSHATPTSAQTLHCK